MEISGLLRRDHLQSEFSPMSGHLLQWNVLMSRKVQLRKL
jgi:hypothetical protein